MIFKTNHIINKELKSGKNTYDILHEIIIHYNCPKIQKIPLKSDTSEVNS